MSFKNVQMAYPGALTNSVLAKSVDKALKEHGYGKSTLLASSLCCDEVNRELEYEFSKIYGDNFSMGGLAGFPFGGATSFGAMAHHIPTDGSCLIIYGPHVGIDSEGEVGKVDRRGRSHAGVCCGSAAAAASYVKKVRSNDMKLKIDEKVKDIISSQQGWVEKLLLPYGERLDSATNPAIELPLALFDAQNELMKEIVESACQEVGGDGLIALLGGIQINTPSSEPDYFLPKVFQLRNNDGEIIEDLLYTLKVPLPLVIEQKKLTSASYMFKRNIISAYAFLFWIFLCNLSQTSISMFQPQPYTSKDIIWPSLMKMGIRGVTGENPCNLNVFQIAKELLAFRNTAKMSNATSYDENYYTLSQNNAHSYSNNNLFSKDRHFTNTQLVQCNTTNNCGYGPKLCEEITDSKEKNETFLETENKSTSSIDITLKYQEVTTESDFVSFSSISQNKRNIKGVKLPLVKYV